MENAELARRLEQMADLLELQDANPFRVRAYRNAARVVAEHAVPLARLVAERRDLATLPGIGKDLARYLRELITTGRLGELDRLAARVPLSLLDLMRLPGVGPKKARRLWQELGVASVEALAGAALQGRIRNLPGFGERSEEKILAAAERWREASARSLLAAAEEQLAPLLHHLRGAPGIARLEVAGSFRRRRETVGDIDLVAVAADPGPVVGHFTAYPRVASIEGAGETRGTVVLEGGLEVDLRVVPAASYGAALVYFTGSKDHNIKLRRRAQERGLRISEYGVFRTEAEESCPPDGQAGADESGGEEGRAAAGGPFAGQIVAGADEAGVYAAVGLPWIAPELREDRGEIEAAERGELPRLLERADLKGDLHLHSRWSDGRDSIDAMLAACALRGYRYCALTDHSQALAMAGGLDARRLAEQWTEIDEVAARHPQIRLLRGLEVDILADGRLDLADDLLVQLDLVVVAVHSFFDLPPAQQTRRVLTALQHPGVHALAHPTARRLARRAPLALDLEEILACCRERQIAVELNSRPDRLDLKDIHLARARELGVPVVISTDAHRVQELDWIRYGVDQARRAWLGPEDVLNARPLPELLRWLARRRGQRS